MIFAKLTNPAPWAHMSRMKSRSTWGRKVGLGAIAMLGSVTLGGCISLEAPDKPIVIELNINISQEVIYRLTDDVRENIEQNPEIF